MSVGSHVCQGDQNHCNILVSQATSARAVAISQWHSGEPSLATGSLYTVLTPSRCVQVAGVRSRW